MRYIKTYEEQKPSLVDLFKLTLNNSKFYNDILEVSKDSLNSYKLFAINKKFTEFADKYNMIFKRAKSENDLYKIQTCLINWASKKIDIDEDYIFNSYRLFIETCGDWFKLKDNKLSDELRIIFDATKYNM